MIPAPATTIWSRPMISTASIITDAHRGSLEQHGGRRMLKSRLARMQRAAKALAKLKLSDAIPAEDLARAAWPLAVGARIASKAVVKSLVRGCLVVEAEDAVWQKNLFQLRPHILGRFNELLGAEIVKDLEFRIATARRPPQPARRLNESAAADESDRIHAPSLRILYKQARKKASA